MSTKIEWCDETWNPIIGCSHVSPGCDNCYAERMANRLAHNPKTRHTYGAVIMNEKWNGFVHLVESALYKPLKWKKPRTIFVCSMGDLFHESVPLEWIDKVMAIAALTPHHTYLILTKRPERIAKYYAHGFYNLIERWENACYDMGISEGEDDIDSPPCFIANRCNGVIKKDWGGMPLTNVWLGVTAENQVQADKRIPILLKIPAAKRFVSVEPMLGLVDLTRIKRHSFNGLRYIHSLKGIEWFADIDDSSSDTHVKKLDWIIAGGETGPNARPMHPEWVRSIRDQCVSAGVPFFFKSWGVWKEAVLNNKQKIKEDYIVLGYDGKEYIMTSDPKAIYMQKIGKKKAGHLIDGKEWRERL